MSDEARRGNGAVNDGSFGITDNAHQEGVEGEGRCGQKRREGTRSPISETELKHRPVETSPSSRLLVSESG